jgi:hypothetical protein
MDRLTAFGLFAVIAMLVCYALEDRSPLFILAFAVSCALGSAYGFLQGAWPFGTRRGNLVWRGDASMVVGELKTVEKEWRKQGIC